jgi:small-conductance mechanosensitive channel
VENLTCELQVLSNELFDTKVELTKQHENVKVKNKEIDKIRKLNKTLKNDLSEQARVTENRDSRVEEQTKSQENDIKNLVEMNRKLLEDLAETKHFSTPSSDSRPSVFQSSSHSIQNQILNNNSHLISAASQTQCHPDIPYSIDCALPPIFGSQLCHVSPKIHLYELHFQI